MGGDANYQEEEEENDEYQGDREEPLDVNFAGSGNGPSGDLDWGDVENYGGG